MGQIIPTYRYDNAPAAIDWLCSTLGFETHAVYEGPNGTIAHAQLTRGDAMIMLGSAANGPFDQLQKPPAAVGGLNTASAYLVVTDPDTVYERALAAGAEVVLPNVHQDYGGRGFTLRDLEGVLWSVGSYDPFAAGE